MSGVRRTVLPEEWRELIARHLGREPAEVEGYTLIADIAGTVPPAVTILHDARSDAELVARLDRIASLVIDPVQRAILVRGEEGR